jgi:WD40 repeat protein
MVGRALSGVTYWYPLWPGSSLDLSDFGRSPGHLRPDLWGARFSPDGKRFVVISIFTRAGFSLDYGNGAGHLGTAHLWNAELGQPVADLPHWTQGWGGEAPQFSRDGQRLLTLLDSANVRIWDAQSGEAVGKPLTHGAGVRVAKFSRDGQRIVTASYDTTARVWDPNTGQPLTGSLNHDRPVTAAQFSADGNRIVTVSGNPTVWGTYDFASRKGELPRIRIWDIAPPGGKCPEWLLELAEAISGLKLNKQGALEPSTMNRTETIQRIRQELQKAGDDDWVVWGRWFLADPATRTLSPYSKVKATD